MSIFHFLSLFDQQIDLRNILETSLFDLVEIWGQLIDFKFDSVIKSAFEQVEGAYKPAKCAQTSILIIHGSATNF
jgi:hypothetical protein